MMLEESLFSPAQSQKLHCIIYSSFCRVLYPVPHYRSKEFPIFKIFLCIWWNFPLNGRNSAKPDLNIWLILSYIPVINARQVWLTINQNLFTQNGFFCHGMTMSIVRLSLFLGLQLLKKKENRKKQAVFI